MAAEEETILATHHADLQNAIVDPTSLAISLFSVGFIPREVRSRVGEMGTGLVARDKATILLTAIEGYISSIKDSVKRSEEFLRLLSILKQHVPIDNVAKAMEREYENTSRGGVDSDQGQ